jgi:hypothetical protein
MKILIALMLMFHLHVFAGETSPLTVTLDTPHPGYKIEIVRIDASDEAWHVLVNVINPAPDRMFPMVVSSTSATVNVTGEAKPIQVYALNQRWNWGDQTVVESHEAYLDNIGDSTPVPFTPAQPNADTDPRPPLNSNKK